MKKKIAFNKLFNLFIIVGVLLIIAGCVLVRGDGEAEPEIALGIGFIVFGAVFVGAPSAFMSCIYVFDEQGVSICYIFLPKERYLWKNIHQIEATDDSTGSSRSAIFDLLFSRTFQISGNVEGKLRFYMNGTIRRSIRTKLLLERYWDGEITGYLFDEIKEKIRERKAKKQGRAIEADEVASQERESRKSAKSWIEPFLADAKQLDLQIDTRFIYVTRDSKEFNSRPKKPYTYIAVAKISACGEENKDKFTEVSADLLFVRLGKKAFIGTVNKTAQEELTFYLEDTLNEIKKNGIDVHCDK
ncbi:MAG: hypothetical protein IJ039_08980 [Clostridia bacterium]|nr:hypothetical protein [Clostridia bacterium]